MAAWDNIESDALRSRIPTTAGSYHFFNYKHTHEGDYTESIGTFSWGQNQYFTTLPRSQLKLADSVTVKLLNLSKTHVKGTFLKDIN